MNAQAFKKMIEEAVRKAVRDELKQLLAEHAASQLVGSQRIIKEDLNFSSEDVGSNFMPKTPQQLAAEKARMDTLFKPQIGNKTSPSVPPTNGDFSAFLMDTARNFNPSEMMGGE
jgi:hypothetical protein